MLTTGNVENVEEAAAAMPTLPLGFAPCDTSHRIRINNEVSVMALRTTAEPVGRGRASSGHNVIGFLVASKGGMGDCRHHAVYINGHFLGPRSYSAFILKSTYDPGSPNALSQACLTKLLELYALQRGAEDGSVTWSWIGPGGTTGGMAELSLDDSMESELQHNPAIEVVSVRALDAPHERMEGIKMMATGRMRTDWGTRRRADAANSEMYISH